MRRYIDGYACDASGKRVVYYDCDPAKNAECKKTMCAFRGVSPWSGGHCDKTRNKAASRDGSKPFYIKLEQKGDELVFAREYIKEAEA